MFPMQPSLASTPQTFNEYYLPPQPTTPMKRLRLMPISPDNSLEEDTTDHALPVVKTAPSAATYEEILLVKGWPRLSLEERDGILAYLWQTWISLSPYQRNCLVVNALGGYTHGGAVPRWSESPNMASMLEKRVQDDFFSQDDYSNVLYHIISLHEGFGSEDAGLPLLDPHIRARHFFTLKVASSPEIVAFAFVVVYRPQALFHTDTDAPTLVLVPKGPLAPVESAVAPVETEAEPQLS